MWISAGRFGVFGFLWLRGFGQIGRPRGWIWICSRHLYLVTRRQVGKSTECTSRTVDSTSFKLEAICVQFDPSEAECTIIMHLIRSSHHPDYMLFQPYPYANAYPSRSNARNTSQPHTLPNKSSCPPPMFCFGAAAGAAVVLTGLA
jgi:hypothetical protein